MKYVERSTGPQITYLFYTAQHPLDSSFSSLSLSPSFSSLSICLFLFFVSVNFVAALVARVSQHEPHLKIIIFMTSQYGNLLSLKLRKNIGMLKFLTVQRIFFLQSSLNLIFCKKTKNIRESQFFWKFQSGKYFPFVFLVWCIERFCTGLEFEDK